MVSTLCAELLVRHKFQLNHCFTLPNSNSLRDQASTPSAKVTFAYTFTDNMTTFQSGMASWTALLVPSAEDLGPFESFCTSSSPFLTCTSVDHND